MALNSYSINNRLFDSYLERMNFLNEISIDHPDSISFGSGRPDQSLFSVKDVIAAIPSFQGMARSGIGQAGSGEALNALGQYNKTKGIVNEDIAKLIARDEDIRAHPEDIIVTDGAQEGMAIIINTLFETPDDILLVTDPSYIGFVGYAKLYGVNIVPVKRDEDSVDLDHLDATIRELKKQGKNPKVFYEVPDFHNPTGAYMPLEKRKQLIQMAEKHNFLIVEDNPYGYFIYDTEKIPTLKALDTQQRVIHLGGFSKTIFPAIRMGYLVADQRFRSNGRTVTLAEELKKTKSFITVNTSPLLQAMVGGFLHQLDYSLRQFCSVMVRTYKTKRDAMIEALNLNFPASQPWTREIKWRKPQGGFFLVMDIPFQITDSLLNQCVEEFSVIVCPMSFFRLDENSGANQVRLAFSNLPVETIREGVRRLALFIKKNIPN
ncbi:MAG: PLP-dependent aminotransferase family protein [bacterium]|nr:PLP-dependent aminotransferase family protein [bacterium]